MFKRTVRFDVVPECDYTDFSDRYEKEKPSVSNDALLGAGIAATASLTTYAITRITNNTTVATTTIPIPTTLPTIEPINVLAHSPTIAVNGINPEMVLQTRIVADASLNMLANVLDPVVQILVAISFPIASVIMIGACFFFMFGNSEKAWNMIMNAGLGYVLIQLSPLFLQILKEIGKAI